jgi:hypothetical protein
MIDFTSAVNTLIGGLLTVVVSVFLAWLQSHMKDKAAATTIGNAVQNSVGAFQQAVSADLASHPLQAALPGISPAAAAGVQYVLNNAGPELARFGITPVSVAEKVIAKVGLANLGITKVAAVVS